MHLHYNTEKVKNKRKILNYYLIFYVIEVFRQKEVSSPRLLSPNRIIHGTLYDTTISRYYYYYYYYY